VDPVSDPVSPAPDPVNPAPDPVVAGPERPLVLVPGACLGAWAWDEVADLLRAAGHDVHPVTLTGLGDRADAARPDVDLETHIADVVDLLDSIGRDDAVLVGHSYAGAVITAVAARRPQRLHAVVYLDAGPLPDGTAIADVQSPAQRDQQRRTADEHGDGWRWPVPDRPTLETGLFGSTAGLTDAHFRLLAERATPQPLATFTAPIRLRPASPASPATEPAPRDPDAPGDPDVPLAPAATGPRRIAILCSASGLDLASARALIAAGDPRLAAFAGADWELHELPTGHWPMLSLPGPLADLLHQVCRRGSPPS
jgi:pimeloyl-ACP methyl ester carboxylesterase